MDMEFVRDRMTKLRLEKNVSERKMSLDLGHSPSYINGISSGVKTPSLTEMFFICEYFGLAVSDFFNTKEEISIFKQTVIHEVCTKDDKDLEVISEMLRYLPEKRKDNKQHYQTKWKDTE